MDLKILQQKYPAKAHAKRVVQHIRTKLPDADGVLYLEGGRAKNLEDSDMPEPFRQRRHFFYLTGCPLADCYAMHDMSSAKTTLFIPRARAEDVMWSGLPMSLAEAEEAFDVDQVRYVEDVEATLSHVAAASSRRTLFAISGQVSHHLGGSSDLHRLRESIEASRIVKDEYEVALIAKANAISSNAHRAVLERVRHASNEQDLEAVFLAACVAAGAKSQAYHSIVASGPAAATLHYVDNNKPLAWKQLLLLDAGAEWKCYASDITRTFPIGGTFSSEARAIYDVVLRMQLDCIAMIKAGVAWEDVQLQAHRTAADGLRKLGILCGDADDITDANVTAAFFPHGVGHYLGLDTHDVGGNADYNDPNPLFRYLRLRGPLPAGSVVTVEPGIYFCRYIIEPVLKDAEQARFVDEGVLQRYWDVGGVRIEDNVLVTETGHVNLTPAVKDADEMENIIARS